MKRHSSLKIFFGLFIVFFKSFLTLAALPPMPTTDGTPQLVPEKLKQEIRKKFSSSPSKKIVVAGGIWTGSGGDGVACFGSTTDAQNAIDTTGKIRTEFRSKIERVMALDTWEVKNELHFLPPIKNESPVHYIERAINRHLKPDMPYFAEKLLKTFTQLSSSQWKTHWQDVGALPLVLDQGTLAQTIPENCRLVQLAIRYVQSTPNRFPRVFIDVDADLIERMSNSPSWADNILFPATLMLHETIWMSGVELNMPDSLASRKLTAAILAQDIFVAIEERPQHLRKSLWTSFLYSLGFKDYFSLFLGDEEITFDPQSPGSKLSRRKARANLSRMYQESLRELGLLDTGDLNEHSESQLIEHFAHKITPEESFLFVCESFRNNQKIPFNLDIFYLDGIDDRAHLHFSCGIITTYLRFQKEGGDEIKISGFNYAMEKANDYCNNLP